MDISDNISGIKSLTGTSIDMFWCSAGNEQMDLQEIFSCLNIVVLFSY